MKKIHYLVLLLIVLLPLSISAQNSEKALARDAAITMKYKEYATAIELYDQLLKSNPDNLEYNYQIGVCYLNSSNKRAALPKLEKVYKANPTYNTDLEFMLAEAYQVNGNFEEAKKHYEAAVGVYEKEKSSISSSNIKEKEKTEKMATNESMLALSNKRVQECENGLKYQKEPINASIENLKNINSDQPDYVPLIPRDTSFMIFTSRREGSKGGKRDFGDDFFFEDIYSSKKSQDGFSSPQALTINRKYHDAGAAVSSDGKKLYLYRDDRKTRGDLYVSEYDASTQVWGEPKKLNDNINTKYQETALTISSDGQTIYFSSDRPGGQGGLDIYMSKLENGDWGKATNLGSPVNTSYDDDAPFLSINGKLLYFSSRGHNTMGGYDIFKSVSQGDNKWSDPTNLGYPINGPDDDVHLVLTEDNKKGYYVSNDPSGMGYEDIYSLTAPKQTLLPLDKSGLTLTTPPSARITKVPEPNFAFRVLFDFDQSTIRQNDKESVENLYGFMNDNPTVRIELGGHTCDIGSLQYNQALSDRRAKAVSNYLIERGVDANRMEVKGYSYTTPSVPNTSPSNRALNRRTEFSVIEK
jgi:outer membrane protein OmpA-like peptidoglycan-associated protein/tetratricopeptide (TPR) repeat protein